MAPQDDTVSERHKVKDCILRALTKLNDKDTQKTAIDELNQIVEKHLDADVVSFFVAALCSSGNDAKPWARRESLKFLGTLTSTRSSYADAILSTPSQMNKLCNFLKWRMSDSDGGVRDAAAEALATVAHNYRVARQEAVPCNHVTLKTALDALQAQKRELQVAAATALQQMAPSVGNLESSIIKTLLRLLHSPTFHAKAQLLAAFASSDELRGSGQGFFTLGMDALLPLLGAVVGSPAKSEGAHGVGCLGCLTGSDWAARKAAAETLHALAAMLGPLLDTGATPERSRVARCADCLSQNKHDRVKPVRAAVADSIAMFSDLLSWMSDHPSGTLAEWRGHRRTKDGVPATPQFGTPPRLRSAGSGRGGGQVEGHQHTGSVAAAMARTSADLIKSSLAYERFVASAAARDTVRVRDSGASAVPMDEGPAQHDGQQGGGIAGPPMPEWSESPPRSASGAQAARSVTPPHPSALNGASAVTLGMNDTEASRQDAGTSGSEDDVRTHLSRLQRMMVTLAKQVTTAFEALEGRVAAVEASLADVRASRPTLHINPYFHPAEGAAGSQPGGRSPANQGHAQNADEPEPSVEGFDAEGEGEMRHSVRDDADAQALQSERNTEGHPPDSEWHSDGELLADSIEERGAGEASQDGATAHERGASAGDLSTPESIDAAYDDVLRNAGSHDVLALMQRTGPCWAALSPDAAQRLLGVMCRWLDNCVNLPAMLPWLYRLADEDDFDSQQLFDRASRAEAIRAVGAVSVPGAVELNNRYALLAETLSAVWQSIAGADANEPENQEEAAPSTTRKLSGVMGSDALLDSAAHEMVLSELSPPVSPAIAAHSAADADARLAEMRNTMRNSVESLKGLENDLTSLHLKIL